MTRILSRSLIATIALVAVLALVPAPAAAAGRVIVRGGYYGGWYGPGWGWGWGPGWYGPGWWGAGYYPNIGSVKIYTPNKADGVFVDGGYAGTVGQLKKFDLRPGAHDVSVRDPEGATLYSQRIEVLRGKTTKIHVG